MMNAAMMRSHQFNALQGWPGGQRRPANWTLQDYVDQWNYYAKVISQNLTGSDSLQIFQGCAFEAPRDVFDSTAWNVANAEADGMRSNMAKAVADHEVRCLSCTETSYGLPRYSTWEPIVITQA
jgi:hypothetical protein